MTHTRQYIFAISFLVYFVKADLQFGKSKTIPPEVDSSAQYRSVIMPKIFGGGLLEKPLKTGNGPYQRQRYYKPAANTTSKSGCSPSPYSTYLNEEDQADLYILVKSARDDGVDEADIKLLMEEYARNSMSQKRFIQFLRDCRGFEACLEKKRKERARRAVPRLFSKQRPQAIKPKNRRHLEDQLNEHYFMSKKITPHRILKKNV